MIFDPVFGVINDSRSLESRRDDQRRIIDDEISRYLHLKIFAFGFKLPAIVKVIFADAQTNALMRQQIFGMLGAKVVRP